MEKSQRLLIFPAFQKIGNCRIEQEKADQKKEDGLQTKVSVLEQAKACKQCADEKIKYGISCIPWSYPLRLQDAALSHQVHSPDLALMTLLASYRIIYKRCTINT